MDTTKQTLPSRSESAPEGRESAEKGRAATSWHLISNRSGRELFPGDEVSSVSRGRNTDSIEVTVWVITGFDPPHKPSASGRVHAYQADYGPNSYATFYCSVFDTHYEERNHQDGPL